MSLESILSVLSIKHYDNITVYIGSMKINFIPGRINNFNNAYFNFSIKSPKISLLHDPKPNLNSIILT